MEKETHESQSVGNQHRKRGLLPFLQYLIVLINCNAELQVMIVYGDNQLIIGLLPPILDLVKDYVWG
jgi:hypothetical protein